MAFQRAMGRASLLTSPKWCSNAQICFLFAEISTKTLQVGPMLQSFILSKTSSDKVVSQSTTYRTVSIWQWMTPIPVKFGPTGTGPQ